jgi:hypothetical protein
MDPVFSGIVFYIENIALACALLFIAASLAFSKGRIRTLARVLPEAKPGRLYRLRKFFRWFRVYEAQIGLVTLFLFGAIAAAIFAVHAAVATPLLVDGVWAWYIHITRAFQVIGAWWFLRGLSKAKQELQQPL